MAEGLGKDRRRRRIRRLLGVGLATWPVGVRIRDGDALLDTAAALVAEAFARGRRAGLRALWGELAALLREGMAMRANQGRRRMGAMLSGWTGDVRYALRGLRRSPGFTAVAVLTLGLGIGANTAVFDRVLRVLVQPPPYHAPEELVLVWNVLPGSSERVPVAGPDAAALAEGSPSLEDLAFALRGIDASLAILGDRPEHVRISATTDNLFGLLGAEPLLGRVFTPDDGPAGAGPDGIAPPVIILGHAAWRRLFAGDPRVIGTVVHLNGMAATVIGVMGPDFRLEVPPEAGVSAGVDLWVPLSVPLTAFHREERLLDRDSDNSGVVVARLAAGATLARARADAERVARDLQTRVPTYAAAGLGFSVRPLRADASAGARRLLWPLGVGVTIVLLAACLNLATLALARGLERSGELSVRAALGADRARLVRQLFVEGAVLVALGSVAAIAVLALARPVLEGLLPGPLLTTGGSTGAGASLAWVGLLAVACAVLGGLGPALKAVRLAGSRRGAGAPAGGRATLRTALVAGQIALSLSLVGGAALLLRTVSSLASVRPGFEPAGALTFQLSLRVPEDYRSPALRAALMSEIARGLSDLPGVEAAGLLGVLPLDGERWTQPYGLPGQGPDEWGENRADFRVVTSGAFEALGTRLIEGRSFTPREDVAEDERVVVVDERLARRIAAHGSAVGSVLGLPVDGAPVEARVVGVVESVRYDGLDVPGREAVYVPYRQEASRDVAFVVRTAGDPAALAPAIRQVVLRVDPRIPVHDVRTLEDYVDEALAPRRFALGALVVFAGLGLVCAAVGLYGVVAWDVRRRTRDLGLRMAVGARRRDILGSVLGRGLRLVGWGLAAGAIPAWATARVLEGILVEPSLADPAIWGAAGAVVVGLTLLACLPPALRAARLDPMRALRTE